MKNRIGRPRMLATLVLTIVVLHLAAIARPQDVKIFSINVEQPGMHPARAPLLLTPDGTVPRGDLYVRLFRGSLEELKSRRRRPGDACVLYEATQVYPVRLEGGVLRVDGLVEFFKLRPTHIQTLTLVFESGANNVSNGQLRLWPGDRGVEKYFARAVEWTLNATEDEEQAWREAAKQSANAARQSASDNSSRSWLDWLLGRNTDKVYAAEEQQNQPVAPLPPIRDCQRVVVASQETKDPSSRPDPSQLAVLERHSTSCSAD